MDALPRRFRKAIAEAEQRLETREQHHVILNPDDEQLLRRKVVNNQVDEFQNEAE